MIQVEFRLLRDDIISFRVNSGIKQALISVASEGGGTLADYLNNMIRKDLSDKSMKIEYKEVGGCLNAGQKK